MLWFSVIIPVYNCKDVLQNTVDSILRSGLSEYEVIIIDDGSKDGTAGVCDMLARKYDNIRCIHQENSGVSNARNRGIETAQGQYLLFFDADDSVDRSALEHATEIVMKLKPDMLIFGLSFDYYFRGKLYRREELFYPYEGLLNQKQWGEIFYELYSCNAVSPVWNKFIRRDLLMKNQVQFCQDLIEMEDFLFSVRCMSYCENIFLLPEVVYRYRQAEDEKSTFNRLQKIPSLSAYMQPFERGMEVLDNILFKNSGINIDVKRIIDQIYTTLFLEQMHFGNIEEIKYASHDMLAGKYTEAIKNSDLELYQLLKKKKYNQVWMRNTKIRMRHWIAIRIKAVKYWRTK